MRKNLFGLLVVSLALALIQPNAIASVKPGTICKKLGQTSTTSGFKYTCIKSGKKLVWNKGVAVKKPTPIPVPTPTATPTPTPSATPTATPTASPTASPIPKAPISFDDLVENYEGIAYEAWRKSREKLISSTRTNISLKMVIGPTTELTYKEPMIPIDLITRMYSGYAKQQEVRYLAFNFADRDWAVNEMETFLPNSGSQWIKFTACRTKETCWGGGAFHDGGSKYLVVVAVGFFDLNHTSGTLDAHEFTHIIQQMVMGKGRPATEFIFDPWPPTWYWEGQAQFAQHASVYHDSFSTYMAQRRSSSSELFSDPAFTSQHIEKYFVFNAPADWQSNYSRWRQYDLGGMFVEILTALKGPDATMEMWKLASTGVIFPVAFERVYGISYAKALPIMAKAIALQLGRN